jgi:glucose/arabinose dehydrogenase
MAVLLVGLSAVVTATVPTAFIERTIASSVGAGTAMAFSPDGRLFVCTQDGVVRVIQNDVLLPTPFMTLTVDPTGERGLLGVAFDPNFAANQFVYFYYTVPGAPAHNRVSRFTASGNVVLPGSELPILELNGLSGATNHNGGAIHFGPDGKLYVAVGENANPAFAQSFANLLGKMLRINPDPANLVPADNPFFNDPSVVGVNKAIWALGLRNPFTFAFQPGTGRMFINDVGAGAWEEINDGAAGANYGWPNCEGVCGNPAFVDPVYSYPHPPAGGVNGCAIVGGAFYNPPAIQYPSSYVGKYFFADLCSNFIRFVDPGGGGPIPSSSSFATAIPTPVDVQLSRDGSLYYFARSSGGGVVRKIVFPSNAEKNFDFELDGKTDNSVWRPPFGFWYAQDAFDGSIFSTQWGQGGDVFVPGDYDGDGRTDAAVWRPGDGTWYVKRTATGTNIIRQFGAATDIPVPGDYDGDGITDAAVFRPGTAIWYVFRSSNGTLLTQPFGLGTDLTVPGDFDGDGKTDFAVWRESDGTFYWLRSSDSTLTGRQFGTSGDKLVIGDYDNDGLIDTAVNRPSSSIWYILTTGPGAFMAQPFGLNTDTLVPGDYDGDGRTDIAVWRGSTGTFYVLRSSSGLTTGQMFGSGGLGDVPLASVYIR